MEVPPDELKYNGLNCDNNGYAAKMQTNYLPSNFTNIVYVDGTSMSYLNLSLPLHQYPISCRSLEHSYNFYLPQEDKFVSVDPTLITSLRSTNIIDRNGVNINSLSSFDSKTF